MRVPTLGTPLPLPLRHIHLSSSPSQSDALRQLRPAIEQGWTVLVLADRGLYAPWLFRRITRLGWHPFLRINPVRSFRPMGATFADLRAAAGHELAR